MIDIALLGRGCHPCRMVDVALAKFLFALPRVSYTNFTCGNKDRDALKVVVELLERDSLRFGQERPEEERVGEAADRKAEEKDR
jgi:hypothetical protein